MDSHPGLQFLGATPEFHARYIETVSECIGYDRAHVIIVPG